MDPEADSPPPDLSLFPKLAAVPTLGPEEFDPPEPRTEQVAGLARRTFTVSRRLFILFVGSGTKVPPPPALAQLDELLAGISIEEGDFYPGSVDPPRFTPRDGWDVGDSGPRPMMADGNFVSAWASTIPYRDAWNAPHADETLRALPENGIVIWIGLVTTNRFVPRGRDVTQPLRLADLERRAAWEGQVRDLPEYLLWAKKNGDMRLTSACSSAGRFPRRRWRMKRKRCSPACDYPTGHAGTRRRIQAGLVDVAASAEDGARRREDDAAGRAKPVRLQP